MKLQLVMLGMVFLSLCMASNAADNKHIVKPRPADAKGLPFSDAVLAGNTLYIAGHIGLDKTGQPPADATEEAHLVMDGIKQTVELSGFTMNDVVWIQIFCSDLKYYDTFNGVYKTYFQGDFPARAFLGTDKLLRGAKYEVMGIAVRQSK